MLGCKEGINIDKLLKSMVTKSGKKDKAWYLPPSGLCCGVACIAKYLSIRDGTDFDQNYVEILTDFDLPLDTEYVSFDLFMSMLKEYPLDVEVYEIAPSTDSNNEFIKKYCSHFLNKCYDRRIGKTKENERMMCIVSSRSEKRHVVMRVGPRRAPVRSMARCKTCHGWITAFRSKNGKMELSPHFELCKKCTCGSRTRTDGSHLIGCSGLITKWSPAAAKRRSSTGHLTKMKEDEDVPARDYGQWFCDFEAADFGLGYHQVYCAVLKNSSDGQIRIFLGRMALDELMDFLLSPAKNSPQGWLWFHNGSGYDFNFMMNHVVKRMKASRLGILRRDNRILTAKVGFATAARIVVSCHEGSGSNLYLGFYFFLHSVLDKI